MPAYAAGELRVADDGLLEAGDALAQGRLGLAVHDVASANVQVLRLRIGLVHLAAVVRAAANCQSAAIPAQDDYQDSGGNHEARPLCCGLVATGAARRRRGHHRCRGRRDLPRGVRHGHGARRHARLPVSRDPRRPADCAARLS